MILGSAHIDPEPAVFNLGMVRRAAHLTGGREPRALIHRLVGPQLVELVDDQSTDRRDHVIKQMLQALPAPIDRHVLGGRPYMVERSLRNPTRGVNGPNGVSPLRVAGARQGSDPAATCLSAKRVHLSS